MKQLQIRQGDVFLIPVAALPKGCKPIDPEKGSRFVLAHGELTGHAHAIYEFGQDIKVEAAIIEKATEITQAAIARARMQRTVQLWALDGEWYLEVRKPAQLKHEEHSAPTIPPGIYYTPIQVEANSANLLRRVAD